jgi:hypothetical protein
MIHWYTWLARKYWMPENYNDPYNKNAKEEVEPTITFLLDIAHQFEDRFTLSIMGDK